MTMHRLTILAVLLLALTGCGGGEDPVKAASDAKAAATKDKKDAAAAKKAAKAKPAAKEQEDDSSPVLSVPEGYRYASEGRRDPFVNPIPKPPPPPPDIPRERPAGLAGVLVSEAKINGIVTSREPGMTKVIISAPGHKAPFIAVRGAVLFDAVIKEIRADEVVFTMISPTTKQPVNIEKIVKTGSSAGTSSGEKR
jgi:hypothetical protein